MVGPGEVKSVSDLNGGTPAPIEKGLLTGQDDLGGRPHLSAAQERAGSVDTRLTQRGGFLFAERSGGAA